MHIDFFSNYLTNGFNYAEAAKSINYKTATCDAICAGTTSLFFSGYGISSVMMRLFNTKIGGINLGKVISATSENMISNIGSKLMQGKSLSDIKWEDEFVTAVLGATTSYRCANKTESSSEIYREAASYSKTAKNRLERNINAGKDEARIKSDKKKLQTRKKTEIVGRNRYAINKSRETATSAVTQKTYEKK